MQDPFATEQGVATSPAGNLFPVMGTEAPCSAADDRRPLRDLLLATVVDHALCHHARTRQAWINAKAQAAQVGISQGAFLPTLSANASITRQRTVITGNDPFTSGSSAYTTTDTTLSLNLLLYDFGARAANLANARALLAAANADHATALWEVYLAAARAYYQHFGAEATLIAAREAEAAAETSLKAASAKHVAGAGTPADVWQARTAYSQAVLNRIRAEGDLRTAHGILADSMGEEVDVELTLAPNPIREPTAPATLTAELPQLLAEARKLRPELQSAAAQVEAAQAAVQAAAASGKPTVNLTSGLDSSRDTLNDRSHGSTVGVSLSFPLSSGFNPTYRLRAAREQVAARQVQEEQTRHQVGLDVWKGYQQLLTEGQALKSAADLEASARQSERVARGRYEAGAGNILDLLTAQSAHADARRQHIQAHYNWHLARITLAQAVGRLEVP